MNKATGFASPALGYEVKAIDLNSLLIQNQAATFFFRLDSMDMSGFGLPHGTLLVVDRSVDPVSNSFVIIRSEGQFLCRLMIKQNGMTVFSSDTKEIIHNTAGAESNTETEIIGTVTASIKTYAHAH